DREVGYVTSAVASPTFQANLALGYVRRECNRVGTALTVRKGQRSHGAVVVELPFAKGLARR
ncbi:MAG: glycine cleavage system aminomethyltransferase GcvT, partial [Verrucomicrobia bacterium]|nr:glycine cleavage system aminomethyltransferase GcvT [Verrucomicrobiota bacterium]